MTQTQTITPARKAMLELIKHTRNSTQSKSSNSTQSKSSNSSSSDDEPKNKKTEDLH